MNGVVMLLHVWLLTERLLTLFVKTIVGVPGVAFVLRMSIQCIETIERFITLDAINGIIWRNLLLDLGFVFYSFGIKNSLIIPLISYTCLARVLGSCLHLSTWFICTTFPVTYTWWFTCGLWSGLARGLGGLLAWACLAELTLASWSNCSSNSSGILTMCCPDHSK